MAFTERTESAYQSLGDNADDGICDQVGFDAHILQTGDGAGGGIGMQGTYHQVSGDGRLYGDAGGLLVTDLTDHDDIRVLTQDGTQCRCESQVCLGVDLYLVDTVNIGLDRILNGDDVHVFFIQFAQCGIQGGGLTTSGRSGYQDDTVRIFRI